MQTDRYAASVASRPVEEIERILRSPHIDALTKNRIKVFSFGARFGRVTARMVYNERQASLKVDKPLGAEPRPNNMLTAAEWNRMGERVSALERGVEAEQRRQRIARLFVPPKGFQFDLSAFHELGIKGSKASRSGTRPKPSASRAKRSRASRPARGSGSKGR